MLSRSIRPGSWWVVVGAECATRNANVNIDFENTNKRKMNKDHMYFATEIIHFFKLNPLGRKARARGPRATAVRRGATALDAFSSHQPGDHQPMNLEIMSPAIVPLPHMPLILFR